MTVFAVPCAEAPGGSRIALRAVAALPVSRNDVYGSTLHTGMASEHPAHSPALCGAPGLSRAVVRLRLLQGGTVQLRIGRRPAIVLSRQLGELFVALAVPASHHLNTAGGQAGALGFKSAQTLVHVLGARLNVLVTRPALRRNIGRLRKALDRQLPGGGQLIEARRGVGWRIRLAGLKRIRSSVAAERR